MAKEFFQEDYGFKLSIVNREDSVKSDVSNIMFHLKFTDKRKQRTDKPAHKDNEVIEFEYNLDSDDSFDVTFSMINISHVSRENVGCHSNKELSYPYSSSPASFSPMRMADDWRSKWKSK